MLRPIAITLACAALGLGVLLCGTLSRPQAESSAAVAQHGTGTDLSAVGGTQGAPEHRNLLTAAAHDPVPAVGAVAEGGHLPPGSLSAAATVGAMPHVPPSQPMLSVAPGPRLAPAAGPRHGTLAVTRTTGTTPTITAVSSSSPNGTYATGSMLKIIVTFSRSVQVLGSPTLSLATGVTPAIATYLSGSGTTALSFAYTVRPGDSSGDLDCTGATALATDAGGAITDTATADPADLTVPIAAQAGSLAVDQDLVIDGLSDKPAPGSLATGGGNPRSCGAGSGFAVLLLFSFVMGRRRKAQ